MPDTPFPDFTLIPAEDDDFSPDDELALAEDPFAIPPPEDVSTKRGFGRSWYIDIEGDGYTNSGKTLYGLDSLVMRCLIALSTKRFENPVFDDTFGMEDPDALIGWMDEPEVRADYISDIRETLLHVDERITEVQAFNFQHNVDEMVGFLECVVIVDSEIEVPIKNVPLPLP